MKRVIMLILLSLLLLISSGSFARALPPGIPRDKTLILPFLFAPLPVPGN